MIIFEFESTEAALEFWQRVRDRKADTLAERQAILLEMTKEGRMKRVQETNRTKEEVLKDWSEHYNVLDVTGDTNDEK